MIKYGYIKNGTCYNCNSRGMVVKHQLFDGRIVTICTSCYKSLNPVEKKEPKVKRGKKYWGETSIEIEFTEYFNQNIDRWFHELIASLKGPEKVCLIKDKWNGQVNMNVLDYIVKDRSKKVHEDKPHQTYYLDISFSMNHKSVKRKNIDTTKKRRS